MFDVQKIKQDFSIFKNNKDLVYLDSAATSLKPDVVIKAMNEYYEKYPYSIGRGSYSMAQKAVQKYEDSRQTIAEFLNVDYSEVIFTRSTTSAINNIANSLEEQFQKGDEIIVTNLEHHSNFLPWQQLSQKNKLKLIIVSAKNKTIDLNDIYDKITPRTKLIAIHHMSNVIGDVVDVKELCENVKDKDILCLVDGAQAVPHMQVDVANIGCDFYIFSGHKTLGPTGVGVAFIKKEIMNKLKPFEYGGDMVESSSVDYYTYSPKAGFEKFEAGTPSIAEVIGLGAAIKYLKKIGPDKIHEHEVALKKYALEKLKLIKNKVTIYNEEFENGLLTFNINDVAVHDAVSASLVNEVTFDSANIALRDGQLCNNLTMKYVLGETSVLRASFYLYNTYEDIDVLINQINKIYDAWH